MSGDLLFGLEGLMNIAEKDGFVKPVWTRKDGRQGRLYPFFLA